MDGEHVAMPLAASMQTNCTVTGAFDHPEGAEARMMGGVRSTMTFRVTLVWLPEVSVASTTICRGPSLNPEVSGGSVMDPLYPSPLKAADVPFTVTDATATLSVAVPVTVTLLARRILPSAGHKIANSGGA